MFSRWSAAPSSTGRGRSEGNGKSVRCCMPRSPLTSRKANVRVPIHQVVDGLRVVVENIPMDQKAKTTSPWRPDLVTREHSRISSIVSLAGWFGLRFKVQRKCRSAYKTKRITKSTAITPESTPLTANSNCCANFILKGPVLSKLESVCDGPTANQSLAAEVPIFWHDLLKPRTAGFALVRKVALPLTQVLTRAPTPTHESVPPFALGLKSPCSSWPL